MTQPTWGEGRRGAIAIVAVIGVLTLAGAAHADAKASRKCRGRIVSESKRVLKLGLRQVDRCRIAQSRQSAPGGPCNVVDSASFDPKGRYRQAKTRAAGRLSARCAAGDPVLANYPGGDVTGVLGAIDDAVAGNSVLVQGNANLGGDRKKERCIRGIGRGRTKVVAAVTGAATACQRRRDKQATTFGPLDASCLGDGGAAVNAANAAIAKACTGVSDAGACVPLPQCAMTAARAAGRGLARSVYSLLDGAPVCGDGRVDAPEQCDDGNTAAGDGCNADCEQEGASCTGPIGTRTVQIVVSTPQPLAGVRIDLDYPQFQSGLPGTAESRLVASRVTALQGGTDVAPLTNDRDSDLSVVVAGATGFIASGPLLQISLDACVPLSANICNRNQNVIGCCDAATDADGDATFQECTDPNAPVVCPPGSFPESTVGPGGTEDCCPADNACVTQTAATTCSVTQPVGPGGAAVDGVGCTVFISGT